MLRCTALLAAAASLLLSVPANAVLHTLKATKDTVSFGTIPRSSSLPPSLPHGRSRPTRLPNTNKHTAGYFSKTLKPNFMIASGDEVIVEMVTVSERERKCVSCFRLGIALHTTLSVLLACAGKLLTRECTWTARTYTRNTAPCRRQPRFDDHWRQGTGGDFQVGPHGSGHDPCGMHPVLKCVPVGHPSLKSCVHRLPSRSRLRDGIFRRSTCLRPHTNRANILDV